MVRTLANKAEFDGLLSEAGDKLVVVDFTATWCPPCKQIAPLFEELSKQKTDVLFAKVDVDENEETTSSQGIEAMPTFLFFKSKKQVDKLLGADIQQLRKLVDQHTK